MTGNTDQILEVLFGTQRLDEVSVSDLKDLLEEFPSFNAAHYLLSKKLKLESSEDFSSETQKTALYFTNPFWLQWLLEAPARIAEPEQPIIESKEEIETSAVDITGSENSDWIGQTSVSQETSSYFEESLTISEEPARKHIKEVVEEETHLPETHLSSLEENIETNTVVGNKPDESVTEYEEIAVAQTEWASEPPVSEQIFSEEISRPKASETETVGEYQINTGNGNGLNFHEPDGFREETIQEIQEEKVEGELVTSPEPAYQEPVEESPAAILEEPSIKEPEPIQEEPHSRQPFFWEKEFHTAEQDRVEEPVEEEPSTVAQIPELVKPFQDNPAFLLAESESLIPDLGDGVKESVHTDPSMEEFEKQEKETRIFFEHNPAIWEPAPIGDKEPVNEPFEETNEEQVIFQTTPESVVAEEKVVMEDITAPNTYAVNKVQEMQAEPAAIATDTIADELLFTPYHTVDYFASQGIQFIQEENPTDKFGKQLKSFTAWLKTMKRLPKTLLDGDMSAMTEAAIQDIAEHSIEEKEVITEAMARVLALQGQRGKAIELYQKLSLLNPSKSAYFAAQIDQIKSDLT